MSKQMTVDELTARLCAVEMIAMMAIGLYLTNTKQDPDYTEALVERMRQTVAEQAATLSGRVRPYALAHADYLIDSIRMNLPTLRGYHGSTG